MKKSSIVFVVILTLSIVLAACSKGSTSDGGESKKGDAIVIGSVIPTSGNNATDGKDMKNAMEMAISEINDDGGVLGKKLKLEVVDDACDPQTATSAANKLVSMKVKVVVGGYCSGSTLPASGVFHNAGIPLVVPAANSSELPDQGYDSLFLINGLVPDQSKTGADYFNEKGAKNIVIVHDNSAYARNMADFAKEHIEKNGGKVVGFEAINPEEKDFSSLMTKLKSLKPDGTYFTGYYAAAGLMKKQFDQKDVSGLFMVGDGSYSQDLIDIAGADAEGILVTATPQASFIEGAEEFVTKYEEKYSLSPGPFSALSYNGVKLVADAIKRADSTDSAKVKQAIKETKGFAGIGQTIEFNDKNTLNESNFKIMTVVNGKFDIAK
ncbi:branched-chain amino acid ABC transporter substrate-binding protein [Viridibacillus sp. NPDC093762]|uniref:branched-chain amino acid ABC transporter substrate-binding protein n=1 Tax=Viridibacillus sp. NPDC093762 TaxID=3390720 RepID=UPI003D007758